LQKRLPDYAVPAEFVVLEALPVTPSGKVDRRALPVPDIGRMADTNGYVAPRTPIEERLAAIWRQLLDIPQVGIHANFFELGGHSLHATQLMARVRAAFGVELPMRSVFESPTVAGLALAITERLTEGAGAADIACLLPSEDPDHTPG
jgi:acyl carrier protein